MADDSEVLDVPPAPAAPVLPRRFRTRVGPLPEALRRPARDPRRPAREPEPAQAGVPAAEPAPRRIVVGLSFTADDLVRVADDAPEPRRPGDIVGPLNETIFGRLGPALLRHGWASYPQTRARKPATVDRRMLQWKPFQQRLPTETEMRSWSLQASGANVAIVLGHANTWAIDCDADDPVLASAVHALAVRIFGSGTGPLLVRYASMPSPRWLMVLRSEPGVPVHTRAYAFSEPNDPNASSGHKLEILGHGACFTAYGIHHKTGDWIKWAGSQPHLHSIDDVPVVSKDQFGYFTREVQLIRPFVRGTVRGSSGTRTDAAQTMEYATSDDGNLPTMPRKDDAYTLDERGVVTTGRHYYMLYYSLALTTGNAGAFLAPAGSDGAAAAARLLESAHAHVAEVVPPDGDKGRDALTKEFDGLVAADVKSLREGSLHAARLTRRADGTLAKAGVLVEVTARPPELAWLGARDQSLGVMGKQGHRAVGVRVVDITAACEAKRRERALRTDRREAAAAVRATTGEAVGGFLSDVEAELPRMRVLKAPTGGGKTVTAIARMLGLQERLGAGAIRPLLLLQPSHHNLREAVATARREGAHVHVPTPAEIDEARHADERATAERVEALERRGLRVVHWRSKRDAGCLRTAELDALDAVGLGSSHLCEVKRKIVDEYGDIVEDVQQCPHFGACGYQRMKAEAKRAHVILAASWWLTADRLPAELRDVSGVVVDESVTLQILQVALVPQSVMAAERTVHATADELDQLRKEGVHRAADRRQAVTERVLAGRRRTADLLAEAAAKRLDPVVMIATRDGALADCDHAVRACRDSMRSTLGLYPDMSVEQVREVAREHGRHEGVAVELRMLRVLAEGARLYRGFVGPHREEPGAPCHDRRIQARYDTNKAGVTTVSWRVSWRRVTNWLEKPLLLLDATADRDLVEATFPTRGQIAWHEVSVDLNIRAVLIHGASFSPSSMVPADDATDAVRRRAASTVVMAQRLVQLVAGAHGHGRTLVAAPIRARSRVLATLQGRIPTLDSVHYGALRGLDGAKHHAAYLGIGRTEWPIWLVDGYVAAATYDRDPEVPYDRLGTGLDAQGEPVRRVTEARVARMRDGRDVSIPVPVMPTAWGRCLDAQWREAEQVQFVGRSRPVHRTETATVVLASTVFPPDIVWDEILSPDEALSGRCHDVWPALLSTGGLVDPILSVAHVEAKDAEKAVAEFVRTYRHCEAMRAYSWTDLAGVTHEGLAAAWVADVPAALIALGMPQACAASVVAAEPVARRHAEPLPVDKVSATFLDADGFAELDIDYGLWTPTHPLAKGEDEAMRRVRHAAAWVRVADTYVDPPKPEKAADDDGAGECREDDDWMPPAHGAPEATLCSI